MIQKKSLKKPIRQCSFFTFPMLISRFTFRRGKRVFEVLVAKKWLSFDLQAAKIRTRGAVPIFLEEKDFKHGRDAFALDFHLMKNEFRLLEGKDPVSKLKINKEHLRLAIETDVRRLSAATRAAIHRKIALNPEDVAVTLTGIFAALEHLKITVKNDLTALDDPAQVLEILAVVADAVEK